MLYTVLELQHNGDEAIRKDTEMKEFTIEPREAGTGHGEGEISVRMRGQHGTYTLTVLKEYQVGGVPHLIQRAAVLHNGPKLVEEFVELEAGQQIKINGEQYEIRPKWNNNFELMPIEADAHEGEFEKALAYFSFHHRRNNHNVGTVDYINDSGEIIYRASSLQEFTWATVIRAWRREVAATNAGIEATQVLDQPRMPEHDEGHRGAFHNGKWECIDCLIQFRQLYLEQNMLS